MKFASAPSMRFLCGAILVALLYTALAYGIWVGLAKQAPGATDFYSRWAGARALFLRGANPYSEAVTREIQIGIYGRPAYANEDQVAFAYPLYAAFFAAPFVGLAYSHAQAAWMALSVLFVTGGAIVLARTRRIFSARPALFAALLLGALGFYPSVRGFFLGQYALVSFFCLAVALATIGTKWDLTAGIFLGLALVKPQPAILLVPVLIAWAAYQRRWKVVAGAGGTLLVLSFLAMLWVPAWPLDFIQAIRRYADYEPVGPPVQTLVEWFAPTHSPVLTLIFGLALLVALATSTVKTLGEPWEHFQPTIQLAAIVTTLMAGRVGTPDQMILLIPWLFWLGNWWKAGQRTQALLGGLVLVLLPWFVFLSTLRGNTENVGVTLLLPLLTLAMFIWQASKKCVAAEAEEKISVQETFHGTN